VEISSRVRMIVNAAREIKNGDVVLVGVGLPNIAANLAKRLYSPGLIMVYESGSVDCSPGRQPLSIGDPSLAENVSSIFSLFDNFSYLIGGGRIDVGFLGAAQIDPTGRINTTVIGDYENPGVRLPGSGGACEILYHSRKSVVIIELNEAKFRSRLDFVTSSRKGLSDDGETTLQEEVVITDRCIVRIRGKSGPEITSIYRDTDRNELKKLADKLGISFPDGVAVLEDPTMEEMEVLGSIDTKGGK
jgi:glutaconate CoA-transferase subunit B